MIQTKKKIDDLFLEDERIKKLDARSFEEFKAM